MKPDQKKDERTAMRKAIDHLRAIGKIESDSDLAKKLNLTKGTVSTYIKGKAGKKFIRQFEEMFQIKLADFSNNVSTGNSSTENPDQFMSDISLGEIVEQLLQLQAAVHVLTTFVVELEAKRTKELPSFVLDRIKTETTSTLKLLLKKLKQDNALQHGGATSEKDQDSS